MPITKVIIENFKGIRDRVEIPIRPITLLFGGNSSGKTTVLHALLYLRELLERQNADADRVIGGGLEVHFGGFHQLVHNHDDARKVTIGVEFSLDADGLEPFPVFNSLRNWNSLEQSEDRVVIDGVTGVDTVQIEVTVGLSGTTKKPSVLSFSVSINGEFFAEISGELGLQAILHKVNTDHSIFAAQYPEGEYPEGDSNPISSSLEAAFGGSKFIGPDSISPAGIALGHSVIPTWGQTLEFEIEDDTGEGESIGAPFTKSLLSQLIVRPGELVYHHLQSYRHLGPIRTIPDLSSKAQRSPDPDRWIDGMAAWDLLSKDAGKKGELIEKVDRYLKDDDRLNLGYSLGRKHVLDFSLDSPFSQLLQRYSASPDDFDSDSLLNRELQEFLGETPNHKLTLTDLRRDVSVDPSNIGAGVSQVIPVLVSVLDTKSKVTAIEQPELHLHPAVQCALADLFVRATRVSDERFFLLESHSEHLLLRLMRRMRETQKGDTPSDDLLLGPDGITILFVETHEGRSVYREMPLNERGELIKAWPGGFFEEDMNELM